jgi:hypothetical protein
MGVPAPSFDKRYKNRRDNAVAINLSLDREAARLLRERTDDNPRGRGQLVSRLIYAYVHQQEWMGFVKEDVRRELEKVGRQVRKDMRRNSDT